MAAELVVVTEDKVPAPITAYVPRKNDKDGNPARNWVGGVPPDLRNLLLDEWKTYARKLLTDAYICESDNPPMLDDFSMEYYHMTFMHGFPPNKMEHVLTRLLELKLTTEDVKPMTDASGRPVYKVYYNPSTPGAKAPAYSVRLYTFSERWQVARVALAKEVGIDPSTLRNPHVTVHYAVNAVPKPKST